MLNVFISHTTQGSINIAELISQDDPISLSKGLNEVYDLNHVLDPLR